MTRAKRPSKPVSPADSPAGTAAKRSKRVLPDLEAEDLEELYKSISQPSWSVPVEKGKQLDCCLKQALQALLADSADNKSLRCQYFYQTVLPLAFNKLMEEPAVRNWNQTTHQNVFDRTEQFLEFFVRFPAPVYPKCHCL